jgi:hypothetical protein
LGALALALLQGAQAAIILSLFARASSSATPQRKTLVSRLGIGEGVAIFAMLILALRMLEGWFCRIGMPTTWDYGPAQLAIHVDLFARGAPLYRDFRIAPFIPLVYGPIVPALTGKLAPLFGTGPIAALEAGRFMTIGSTLLVWVMIFLLARRIGSSPRASLLAGLAFLLSPIVLRWGFEYRVDMPVLACELSGLVAFAGGATAIAMALFVASFFIKQAHAVGIATVVLFCWISGRRRRAVTLALIWLALVAAGTVLLARLYPYYLLNEFGAVRTTSLDLGAPVLFLAVLVGANLGITIFAIVALTRRRMTDRMMLCLLIVASVHDVASCLRWGSNAYYFLPMLAALTIIAGPGIDLVLECMRSVPLVPQLCAEIMLAILLSLGFILAPRPVAMGWREVVSPSVNCDLAGRDPWDPRALEILRSINGTILTDAAELKLVDERENLQWIDLMVLTSMVQIGTFDDKLLLDAIWRRQVAAFALDDEHLARSFRGRPLFWPRLQRAIEANYETVPGVGPPYLMLPKRLAREGTRHNTKVGQVMVSR